MAPNQVDAWLVQNEAAISSIVEDFRGEPCLCRVELGSMEYIDQNCKSTHEIEFKIKKVQSKVSELGVVLATSYHADDGRLNTSIIINRQGIAVSGGGLAIEYWTSLRAHWQAHLECGELIQLSKPGWYAEIMHSEPSCASNKSSKSVMSVRKQRT